MTPTHWQAWNYSHLTDSETEGNVLTSNMQLLTAEVIAFLKMSRHSSAQASSGCGNTKAIPRVTGLVELMVQQWKKGNEEVNSSTSHGSKSSKVW